MFQFTSTSLPEYEGPLRVGSVVIETSVPEELRCQLPSIEHEMKTVKLRMFYPLLPNKDVRRRKDELWLPFNEGVPQIAKGFKWWMIRACASWFSKTSLPVYDGDIYQDSSRNVYSSLCGNISSYGIVVLALEHRDQTAIISTVRDPADPDDKGYLLQYHEIKDFYSDSTVALHKDRFFFREREIQLAMKMIRSINEHGVPSLDTAYSCSADPKLYTRLFESLKGRLNTTKGEILLSGHSFGAATCAYITNSSTPSLNHNYLHREEYKCAILYDIWMFPVRQLNIQKIRYPTLMIISYEFHRWTDNYEALKTWLLDRESESQIGQESAADKLDIVSNEKTSHVFVLNGTVHANQSDLPILLPSMVLKILKGKVKADPYEAVKINTRSSVQFLRENGIKIQGENDPDCLRSEVIPGWEKII
ncbi:PAF family phospholipase A2 [Schizosaccharomyces cryophilus OY26]|uniref:Putative phospholipase n=1 Tax=Schizosaccharomyces cryophilus (strain OY26 / ATCC MYA-4695 / CBS 11777 / NBRC 106824 / NRRL Y48691) TaxID=653667 RepID=S9VZ26_SCHCR|nr:PAF family phospholipase A2 [Schizosaccharomyces cryophilus OY26]EPY51075.1 PAF family phospholipase A2 [Schizosaccharomyces cryophilus OY26]